MEPGLYFMRWKNKWRGQKPILGSIGHVSGSELQLVCLLGHSTLHTLDAFTDFIRLPVQMPEEALQVERILIAGKEMPFCSGCIPTKDGRYSLCLQHAAPFLIAGKVCRTAG